MKKYPKNLIHKERDWEISQANKNGICYKPPVGGQEIPAQRPERNIFRG
jgi:hypothetical protein